MNCNRGLVHMGFMLNFAMVAHPSTCGMVCQFWAWGPCCFDPQPVVFNCLDQHKVRHRDMDQVGKLVCGWTNRVPLFSHKTTGFNQGVQNILPVSVAVRINSLFLRGPGVPGCSYVTFGPSNHKRSLSKGTITCLLGLRRYRK